MAPHHRRLGLQPPRPDRPRERRRPAHGLVAGAHPGVPVGHAARLRRGAVHAQPQRRHPGHRRGDRRPHLGAPARRARRRRRVPAGRPLDQQPQHRHLRPAHHRHERRHPRLRPRRRDRRDGVGDRGPRLPRELGHAGRGPDNRRRQGRLGPQLPAAGRARGVRGRRPRRPDGGRGVAAAAGSGARRARRRELGQRAVRGAHARRRVDGPQLRPRPRPRLSGHVGYLAGPEVHARRGRQPAPLPQLDAGAGRRHRRDPLVLPAPERPLGPRPSLRAHPRRHRGRPRPPRR